MRKHRRHAAAGDRENWGDARRIEHERSRRSFEAAAGEAQQDPHKPDVTWLADYFRRIRTKNHAAFARRRARDVAFYLADFGVVDLMNDREIQTVLYCADDEDPLSFDFEGSIAGSRRLRLFGNAAYAAGTMQNYATHAKRYVKHCRALGLDHLNPPPDCVRDWLASLGHAYAWRTVRNARNSVSHLFQKNGCVDLARSPEIDSMLEGLRNVKPPQLPTALTSEERYRILSALGSEGLDIRDRVAILIAAFSNWGVERSALIDIEHISLTGEGVVLETGVHKVPVIIGRHKDPELDLDTWIRKLIRLVGTGPLFQTFEVRKMRFSGNRLSPQVLLRTITLAVKRAGVDHVNVTARLRLLFELECRDVESDVVLRHYNVLKPRAIAKNPDDRTSSLRIRRKGGFSIIAP